MSFSLSIPQTDKAFYLNDEVKKIRKVLVKIDSRYGDVIETISKITLVSENILKAFIYEESNGKPEVKSYAGAIGLMQLKPSTANDIIYMKNRKKRLNSAEKEMLSKHIGNRAYRILLMKHAGQSNYITPEDMIIPEFNILCGAIFLSLLIDQETKNGSLRMDNVILRYGRGYFFKNKAKNFNESLILHRNRPESYNSLLKIAGKNGLLDILTS